MIANIFITEALMACAADEKSQAPTGAFIKE
jgi:hypothetical protein